MTLREFIRTNRKALTAIINRACGNDEDSPMNDSDRETWVMNDEGLYNWARSEGVRI